MSSPKQAAKTRGMSDLTVYGFHGMCNLDRMQGKIIDENRVATPRIVLNADPVDGVLLTRRGYALTNALEHGHSLWGGSVMLCATDTMLYRIEGSTAVPLYPISSPHARINYAEIDGIVYMSTPYWCAEYDIINAQMRSWGLPIPKAPEVVLGVGDLPPGVYNLCYTTVDGDRLSGHGAFTRIRWEQETRGITLANLTSDVVCWITQPDSNQPALAMMDGTSVLGATANILPTHGVTGPPGFFHFVPAFGRVWGACGKKVYYSHPFQPEWFHPGWFLPFPEDIVLIAPSNEGLFINSRTSTWWVEGRDPSKMKITRIGDGAIPGTLTIAQVEGGGYEISRKLSQEPSPAWVNRLGFVVGTATGHIVRVTEGRVNIPLRSQGASIFWHRDGYPQIISSLTGSVQNVNAEILRISNEGKLFE